ncbi:MAG: hypothetical protein H0V04_00725 [Chloroflexi bacterium]|nr:hypothetical protein [Chloroflexota bacterium]
MREKPWDTSEMTPPVRRQARLPLQRARGGAGRHEDPGHEIFVFGRDKDLWRCVWRHVVIDGQGRT